MAVPLKETLDFGEPLLVDVVSSHISTPMHVPEEDAAIAIDTAVLPQSHVASTSPDASETSSLLFKLPPELRNVIYEDVLTLSRCVVIDNGVPEPPLLLANKQIRNESRGIFYARNKFGVHNYDYNSSIYLHTAKLKAALSSAYRVPLNLRNLTRRQPNWANLLK